MPEIELDPDLVLVVFLPPLLYAAAFFSDLRALRADLRAISMASDRSGAPDDRGRRRCRARSDRALVAAGFCARRDRLAHGSGRRFDDHAPARRSAPAREPRRGREPRERRDRARRLPGGRGGCGGRELLGARRGVGVRGSGRRRCRDRAGGRFRGRRDPAPARRRADRDHDLAAHPLRRLHPRGRARPLGCAGRGDRRHLSRLACTRAGQSRDASREHRGVADPRLPAQRHPVHPDRPAAPRDRGRPRRLFGRRAGRLLRARLRHRDRCPFRLYVHGALRDPGAGSPALSNGRGEWARACGS